MDPINLICFPYAGGNTYSYNVFRKHLDGKLNIITPELPGRGQYYEEPFVKDLHAMADGLFNQHHQLFNKPYALYGHSMGGILAYLLARRIKRERLPEPIHFFCSGCKAPSIKPTDEFHKLPDAGFIAQLRKFGGSPEEVLNHKDIMEFLFPIIRADFEAAETFQYRQGIKLNTPVTVLISDDDKVSKTDAEAWQTETTQPISVLNFPGNHFFIFEKASEICNIFLQNIANSKGL